MLCTAAPAEVYSAETEYAATLSGSTYADNPHDNSLSKVQISSIKLTSKKKWNLKWKKVSGANGYDIARATEKNGKYKIIKKISSRKTLSYTDKNHKTQETLLL